MDLVLFSVSLLRSTWLGAGGAGLTRAPSHWCSHTGTWGTVSQAGPSSVFQLPCPHCFPRPLFRLSRGKVGSELNNLSCHPFRETEFKKTMECVPQPWGWTASDFSPGAEWGQAWHRDEEAQVCGAVKRLCITEHPLNTSGVL